MKKVLVGARLIWPGARGVPPSWLARAVPARTGAGVHGRTCLDRHIYRGLYTSPMESSFAIVAEPNRRAILSLLLDAERSVGELERELRLSQPAVSKHLRVLRDAGFVESR